jgi:hypothetical protein
MTQESLAAAAREVGALYGNEETGPSFRVAARLRDGFYLPCVLVERADRRLQLAERRLKETRGWRSSISYRDTLRAFVIGGSRVDWYDIAALEPSPYAIPVERLREVEGETSMGWTQFGAVMNDGAAFQFGTSFHDAFFEMPEGYAGVDVSRITPVDRDASTVWRSKPFFTCYVEGL